MLFLRAIHPRYEGLVNQFTSKQKNISTASINLVRLDAKYMDGFIPVGAKGKAILPPSTPHSPAAATVVTNSNGKEHALVSSHPPPSTSPSCCHVSLEAFSPGPACFVTQLVDDIVLPPDLIQSLLTAIPTTSSGTSFRLVVADTGATPDHMVPDRGAFISYKSIHGFHVHMGNNSFAPVLGRGMVIISLNSQCLLIRNVLHVPGLRVPLYSLRAHLRQSGCGFLGSYKTGMCVYFPGVVLTVDTSSDCHLSYKPLGKTVALSLLHYVQPRCPPVVYPTETERSALLALPHPSSDSLLPSDSPTLLPTLSHDDITRLVHHAGSSLPPICPCNRANGSDMKTHWTPEELHHALRCCHFRNYKHIFQTSLDGHWLDGFQGRILASSQNSVWPPSEPTPLSTSHTTPYQVVPSAALSNTVFTQISYFAALCSIPICRTTSALSHLSSMGRQIIRRLHHVVPSGVLCDPISPKKGWFFCRFLFLTMSVLNSLWLAAFPAPFFMDARIGGVVPRVYLQGIFCIPRGMPSQ